MSNNLSGMEIADSLFDNAENIGGDRISADTSNNNLITGGDSDNKKIITIISGDDFIYEDDKD